MGLTWNRMTPKNEIWGPAGVRAGWPIDFQVDPDHADTLFANAYGGGNFLSTNGGKTWTDASKGYTGALIKDITVDPKDGNRVYASGRNGIFLSTNGGTDWQGLNINPAGGLDNPFVAIDPHLPNRVMTSYFISAGRPKSRHPDAPTPPPHTPVQAGPPPPPPTRPHNPHKSTCRHLWHDPEC